MIAVLKHERWPELKEIFDKKFDSELPVEGKADIIAELSDDGSIQSFILAEHLMRIGLVHSENGYPRRLIRWLEENMPVDNSVIAIASEPRYEALFERLKMYPVEGKVFRRDF